MRFSVGGDVTSGRMAFRCFRWSSYLSLALVLVIGAACRFAWAGEGQAQAEKLIRHGVELRKSHDDEAAAREFQKAYDLVHSPRASAQLGLAEQALGRWEDAERHVDEALHAPTDAWIAKNRATLEEALGIIQAHLGRIEVIGDPAGAEVSVNGRSVGTLPLADPVKVSAGQVDVEMHAPGYVAAERTLAIVGGQYQRVVIHLAKEGAAAEEPKAAPNPEPSPPIATPAVSEEGPSTTRVALKWTSAGLAGAALVTGVLFTVLHSNNVDSFNSNGCSIRGDQAVKGGGIPDAPCQSMLGTSQTYQKVFIAAYAAAGAFAATWLIFQLTEPSSPAQGAVEHALRGPVCAPALSGAGVSCAVRF